MPTSKLRWAVRRAAVGPAGFPSGVPSGPTRAPRRRPRPAGIGSGDGSGPLSALDWVPTLNIQVSALQAMCRQVFGFRLAMIALSAPLALTRAADGLAAQLVGAAVLVTFMGSYLLFRDWERFGPLLLRHPVLLAVDSLFGALLLFAAGPENTLGYVTVCTPLLAGLVYSWRGAAFFACLESVVLLMAYGADSDLEATFANASLLPGLCIVAGAVGVTLRNLMLGFGTATQALTETRARLAVTEAVGGERARLAREMHDSVAKTLHGLAMAADGLATSAGRMDPVTVRDQAELVARSARRAAAESRELLSDLRREGDLDTTGVQVVDELSARVADFSRTTGIPAAVKFVGSSAVPPVPHAVARHLLTVATEALENAHRHGRATEVSVEAGIVDGSLRIGVLDNGRGLPPGTTLDALRKAGHFGLVGMVERAAGIGARIRIGKGRTASGTEVRLDLPVVALLPPDPTALPPPSRH
ncbi:sensor histidine kinase [Streptomyces sp. H27-D2]|uniref:sensor histidine kinase n=1 Tax=Streptomyces sp. H27-D2 TaxID=3046304 RepID=UPI002DBAB29E|nr:histidine kinase [Streptomyces sp. H27-D2]MEC4017112.1 histidine kinase [Streptomyces sp. H27-D2]